ncbi:MAG TPA: hypothetical protein PKL97_05430 [Candidatus Omnitrophota bacterium]|nr:hypothetical protein [Candidatus Omnitrophota bacterium]
MNIPAGLLTGEGLSVFLRGKYLVPVLIGIIFSWSGSARAESERLSLKKFLPMEYIDFGQSEFKPADRFDVRFRYDRNDTLPKPSNLYTMILRYDEKIILNNQWTIYLRSQMPLKLGDAIARHNRDGDYRAGLGDFFTQLAFIPPHREEGFVCGAGTRVYFPTATERQFGDGKYELAPLVGMAYFPRSFPKGSFIELELRDRFDFAGNRRRAHVHRLSIQPNFFYNLPRNYFVGMNPEIIVNWKDDASWFVPFHAEVGRTFKKKYVLSFNYNQGLVKDFKQYDIELELRFGVFF